MGPTHSNTALKHSGKGRYQDSAQNRSEDPKDPQDVGDLTTSDGTCIGRHVHESISVHTRACQ